MQKEVVMLSQFGSNNPGETCSFEEKTADKLVENKVARHATDEDVDKIHKAHHAHKAIIARESTPKDGAVPLALKPSERKRALDAEKKADAEKAEADAKAAVVKKAN